jgi:hypothetical protein
MVYWKMRNEETARQTLEVTQKGVIMVTCPVEKRFRMQPHIRKKWITRPFYLDTCFLTSKNIRGNKVANITTDGKGFGISGQ